ncbi:hypothetical protein ANCDUO_07101 [Ancylostoma duodenale]|uniref:Uncharacterized protein n=1 Tax=Ancylostoma duodenale TaxID=51022 RepID=A0A0C2GMT6_9BILA|nr:hypothetical protein ANCDUO_07101 [Ancylostoma duodenale]
MALTKPKPIVMFCHQLDNGYTTSILISWHPFYVTRDIALVLPYVNEQIAMDVNLVMTDKVDFLGTAKLEKLPHIVEDI